MKPAKYIRSCAAALFLPGAVAGPALADTDVCKPVPVVELVGCSLAAVQEARRPGLEGLPGMAQLARQHAQYLEEVFDGPRRPGQARLTLSGIVAESGSACAQPVAALDTVGLMMSGAIDEDAAGRSVRSRAAQIREGIQGVEGAGDIDRQIEALMGLMGSAGDSGMASGMDVLNALVPEDGEARDVIFHVSSPAAYSIGIGMAVPVIHSGVTGWSKHAASGFAVQLPGTTAADLEPGESYHAVAEAPKEEPTDVLPSLPAFYMTWDESPEHIQHTTVGGRLEGEVVIEEINDAAVYGYLELSGQAWAETVVREITEHGTKLVERIERNGPLTLQGRFEAPNDGALVATGFSAVAVDARGGERAPVLSVERYFPPSGARNADVVDPDLTVVFDRSLDRFAVMNETARLEYRDAAGNMARTDVDVTVEDDTLHLKPARRLEPAAWYRAVIAGGNQGPKGRDGAMLPGPFAFTFATAPEEYEITPSLFQVVRDAPLIAGKQTLTRLYVEWERPESAVHESWHVKTIPANAWVTDESKLISIYDTKRKIEIPNHELATDEEERLAKNTVNFFDWEPGLREVRQAVGFIEPLDPCDRPLEKEDGATAVAWSDLQKALTFDYYMVRVGSWSEEISSSTRELAHRIVAAAERFTLQTFPVTNVTARPAGDFVPSEEWRADWEDALARDDHRARLMLLKELELAAAMPGVVDLVVAFLPPDMWSGGSSYERDWHDARGTGQDWVHFLMPFTVLETNPRAITKPVITHEIGHNFGLEHRPYVADATERAIECRSGGMVLREGKRVGAVPANTWMQGIEGFRLSLDGSGGANKSYEEGNGETTWGLLPLMYPCSHEYEKHFILREHYLQLVDELRTRYAEAGDAPGRDGSPWYVDFAQSLQPVTTAQATENGSDSADDADTQYIVTGMLGEPSVAAIDHVVPANRRFARSAPEGNAMIVLRDAEGNGLAQRSVGPHLPSESGGPFATVITSPAPPHSVTLRRGETVLARRSRSDAAPEVAAFRVEGVEGDQATLAWQASDADGDPLSFTVLFRRGADDSWRVIAPIQPDSSARIHRSALPTGARPQFRLIASDGMNRTIVDLDAAAATRDPKPAPVAAGTAQAEETSEVAVRDAGPPRYAGGLTLGDELATARTAATDSASQDATQPLGGPDGTIVLAGQSHEFRVERCERKSLGALGSAIELSGTAESPSAGHLAVSVNIVDMQQGAHQLVEARQIDGGGQETAVYVAMHRHQGQGWQSGLGEPVDGPLLSVNETVISGAGEFHERSGIADSIGEGRFEAHCPGLAD